MAPGTTLPEAILAWASTKPSPFEAEDGMSGSGGELEPKSEGYLTGGEIATALEAAVGDDLIECEEVLNPLAVGKALGKLLKRQEHGEAWLGILFRWNRGSREWRIVPAEPKIRDARAEAASALGAKLSTGVHRYCHAPPSATGEAPDVQAWTQSMLRECRGSLTSIAEIVHALAGVSLPLVGSQLGLPLLLTAATDEIGAAQFDLVKALLGTAPPGAKRRPPGGAARNSPNMSKRRGRTRVPSPVVQADVALAEGTCTHACTLPY